MNEFTQHVNRHLNSGYEVEELETLESLYDVEGGDPQDLADVREALAAGRAEQQATWDRLERDEAQATREEVDAMTPEEVDAALENLPPVESMTRADRRRWNMLLVARDQFMDAWA